MHVPQSVEAATELREIAAVPKQLISPRLSKPLVSVVQDTLVGVNRLTRPTEFFTRREFMNLLVHSKRWDGRIPPPAKTDPVPLWSGKQVVSALLPSVYLAMGNKMWDEEKGKGDQNYVVINNGNIENGILDGDVFDKALIHILYNDFSPEMTVDFLDSLQAVVATYLQNSGFSVGLSDLIADQDTLSKINTDIEGLKKNIESIQLQVHMGLFDNASGRSNQEEFEGKVFQSLDKAISSAGKTGLKSLSANNRMVNMVKCGSKGSDVNIAQMLALLGQQSIEGRRIAYGFQDRTLPHFKRYDDGAESRGFIESSFVKGLNPAEFFFHAMTGREGLIDTAVKSVTWETPIIVMENGLTKRVPIGEWIDRQLDAAKERVEHFEEREMELLQLNEPVYIPTADEDGKVTWGEITAITRHDPGKELYEIKTLAGKSVIVTESKSLLIYNEDTKKFERMSTPDVRPGHYVPVTMNLATPPTMVQDDHDIHRIIQDDKFPASILTASNETIVELLKAYCVQNSQFNSDSVIIRTSTAENSDMLNMLCSRMGVFGSVDTSYSIHIVGGWAEQFMNVVFGEKKSYPASSILTQNDVILDKIVEINPIDVAKHPKVYDLTVPSTLNFGLANGLHVVDTADSGYMQRQLVKTMEDLTVFHDGSVRDAGGLLVQFAYGDDGTSATKIENQPIGLGKMSDAEIRAKFSVEDVSPDKSQEYLSKVFEDRDILVNNVWGKRVNKVVQSAVHIPRLISNAIQQLGLAAGKGTPVPGAHVLSTIDSILQRTRADNRLWAALLRYHLNPRDLQGQGFTRAAFDWLAEQIVVKHMKSWVVPGEMAGIISAQSLGEPTTQMTLNSVDWNTEIVIAKNGEILTPKIGEFIDDYIEKCDPAKIQYLENEQIYVPLDDGHDWSAISCDENGKMMWTKLEAITKHPVVNEDGTNTILEVTLESGRTVRATKGKSFLTLRSGKLLATNGSDLEVGDELPIINDFAMDSVKIQDTFNFRSVLPATEFLYGSEVQKALAAMRKADLEGNRHWYSHANGKDFTVPYGRSDAFRDAYTKDKNGHAEEILPGFVYPKKIGKQLSQIPETVVLDREFGFFMGMYVAEGSTSPTQIQITNNDDTTLAPIRTLLDKWKIGHHTVSVDKVIENTGIKGRTTSLIIHSTLLTAAMKKLCGKISYEKTFPNWVLQAPDDFVKGFVDGYFTGDGCVGKDTTVTSSSVSEELITNLSLLLSRYGIFTTHASYMPNIRNFKSVSRQYQMAIPTKYSVQFAKQFTLTSVKKQDRLNVILTNENRICKRKEFGEVVMDKIKTITEIEPVGGKMFDLTVEKSRNFVTKNRIGLVDTFHLSGVSAKSGMTRGVPRLKELLKVSQNPKATSLTIPLRTDIRTSKEDARRLAQELEFTMLKDLVTTSRIYYDPRDDDSLIAEDKEWLSFFAAFEQDSTPASEEPVAKRSPWILRLELDREKMFNKNITMEDINFILKKANTDMEISYTDHNASRMIVRVRVPTTSKELDDLATIKQWQNKLLTSVSVRGLPGLRSVTFRKMDEEEKIYEKNTETGKYEAVEQFVLDTFGTNLLDVMVHPDIDGKNVISNHVYEVYENLGIEAARQILFKEIFTLFEQAAPVNYRHVALLCDTICCRGRMLSADRYGVAKKKNGPLAKASFEQTGDIMLKAAVFGEMDAITGVSANIMTGQPIRGGTSFSQVLLDESAMQEFMTTAPPPRRTVERAPRLVQAEIEQMLDAEKAVPGCRQEDLRIPVVLPPMMPLPTVSELPELEINLIDE